MQKKVAKKKKDKFSYFKYAVLLGVCALLRVAFRTKRVSSAKFLAQKKSGAMLIFANHCCTFDFAYFIPSIFPGKVNFVVAENMLYSGAVLGRAIKWYGAITKKQYYADISCVRRIKKCLDAGISVVICPEGKVSPDGVTGHISDANGKLVKWLGYPVATCVTRGSSLAMPKWAHNTRLGRCVTESDILFTSEDVKTKSVEELTESIREALYNNDAEWQKVNGCKFIGTRRAEGAESVLYKCPKCGAEFTTVSKGNYLTCSKCKNKVRYTVNGTMVPVNAQSVAYESVHHGLCEERKAIKDEVGVPDFTLKAKVLLFVENPCKFSYKFVGSGSLTLSSEGLEYTANGTRHKLKNYKYGIGNMTYSFSDSQVEEVEEEFKSLKFPISLFEGVAFMCGYSLDLYDDKHSYRFMFSDVPSSTKFAIAMEELHKRA